MDKLTPERRSANMSKIRSKDTKPEMSVRKLLHRLGYRYRLHVSGVTGKPDIVFSKEKIAIFVHGCFWHQHENCKHAAIPKSRPEFWLPKLARNKQRDEETVDALKGAGWRVAVIWECETRSEASIVNRLTATVFPTITDIFTQRTGSIS